MPPSHKHKHHYGSDAPAVAVFQAVFLCDEEAEISMRASPTAECVFLLYVYN